MKKQLSLLALTLMLVLLCGGQALAAGATYAVMMDKNSSGSEEWAELIGTDSGGQIMWSVQTGRYPRAELDSIGEIGSFNDTYYYVEDGMVVALNMKDGSVKWKNMDFKGAAPASPEACLIDENGTLYLCGYHGPDFFAVNAEGRTLKRIAEFNNNYYWPFEITKPDDNTVAVKMTMGPDQKNHVFEVNLSDYSYALVEKTPSAVNFTDVAPGAWYAESVNWAVEEGITSGTTAWTFSPDETCTTAQILTLLWRANGSPEPGISNPYADVKRGDYFYNAALWAAQKKLTAGGVLDGSAPCTRSMVVTYLWKLSGSPNVGSNPFTDVGKNAGYAAAVSWAVKEGITSGTSTTTFSPGQTCTRAQIVTFMYRYYNR